MSPAVLQTFDTPTSGDATSFTCGANNDTGPAAARQHSTAKKINGASMYVSGSTSSYLIYNPGYSSHYFVRLYVLRETTSNSASNCTFISFDTSQNISVCRLGFVSNTGNLMVRDGATIVAQYPTTIDQWYRIDWSITNTGNQMVRMYTGATLHSANTSDAVAGGETLALSVPGQSFMQINLGMYFPVNPPVNFYIDELAMDRSLLPPPYVPANVNDCWVWNGTTPGPANMTVWNGTTEAAAGVSVT